MKLVFGKNAMVVQAESATDDEKRLQKLYRNVFSSPEGKVVFADMLFRLCFFGRLDPDNPKQVALHNFAEELLTIIGAWRPENFQDIVTAMFQLRYEGAEE